jgi:hypothetical protein
MKDVFVNKQIFNNVFSRFILNKVVLLEENKINKRILSPQ